MKYIIITKCVWEKKNYKKIKNILVINKLNKKLIKKIKPKIIFFIHWSNMIDKSIYNKYLCIQFHCSNLPKGRGGSPIQNQIIRGIKNTKLSAFKVSKKLDSGPVCLKENLSLRGNGLDILIRLERKSIDMIKKITKMKQIVFSKQIGKPTFFKRRTKKQSKINIKSFNSVSKLYDFMRMLDAPGYPNAYFELNKFKLSFNNLKFTKNAIYANTIIKKNVKK